MHVGTPHRRTLLGSGFLITLVATAGSLYFSLGLHLYPCRLCWYQRILMYPLVIIFGVGLAERRASVYRMTLPLSALGVGVAAYHSALQRGLVATGSTCGAFTCASIQYTLFGLLTIPNLALVAFSLLTGIGVGLARSGPLARLLD